MPRKNSKARVIKRPKKIKAKPSIRIIVDEILDGTLDYISPGVLVAAAEWRRLS